MNINLKQFNKEADMVWSATSSPDVGSPQRTVSVSEGITMNDHVIINCGYLKDGYLPVTADIWIAEGSIFIKFSNSEDEYCISRDKFLAIINFLEGKYEHN